MSLAALTMWAVVGLIGIPAAWKNPTAAALVLCWIVGEAIFVLTGNNLPVDYYLFPDIFVIAVIFMKPDWNQSVYEESLWKQYLSLTLERSPSDRCVLYIFPVMWAIYVSPIDPYQKWWMLWGLAILQFLFASAESLETFFMTRRVSILLPSSDEVSRFAWGRGYG